MTIIVSSKNQEQRFEGKEIINIGTNLNCDFYLDLGFDLLLTLNYSAELNKCILVNNFNSKEVLFRGQPIGSRVAIEKMCKLMIPAGDDFISIKIIPAEVFATQQQAVIGQAASAQPQVMSQQIPPQMPQQQAPVPPAPQKTMSMIQQEDFNEADIRGIYGSDVNAETKIKLDKRKSDIERKRVSILKEIGFYLDDLKKKLDINNKTSIFANTGLVVVPFLSVMFMADAFQFVADTSAKVLIPPHVKALLIFAIIVCLLGAGLKQGIFLYMQNKTNRQVNRSSKIAENSSLVGSLLGFITIYAVMISLYFKEGVNLPWVAVVIGAISTGVVMITAMFCGHLKHSNMELGLELDRHESREDFQGVIQEYQHWIHLYLNNLSRTRIKHIKDKLFSLQLKSFGEIVLGILTAPFLAYGVSNTLAMCFPDAAGWIRVSGFRYSPIFLTLSTFLIIFAFFSFAASFLCTRKARASEVIKRDGFSNYQAHGVDLYGTEGIKKLQGERLRFFLIGATIIFIEFSMNISYFVGEIGGDFNGIFLSSIAALVPTSLLLAETYMLSGTQFHIFAHEELLSKIDKDID